MAKMTYAKIAEKLNKEYNKYDKNLQNAVTDAEKNSAMMMLQRVSSRLNQLMVSNQSDADMQDAKNPPANSPNQSIGRRTTMMAQSGGMPPNPNQVNSGPYNRPFLPLETNRMKFLGDLPNQSVDFQLPNFNQESPNNNVLANRLYEAHSLNQLPYQNQDFQLPNFKKQQALQSGGGVPIYSNSDTQMQMPGAINMYDQYRNTGDLSLLQEYVNNTMGDRGKQMIMDYDPNGIAPMSAANLGKHFSGRYNHLGLPPEQKPAWYAEQMAQLKKLYGPQKQDGGSLKSIPKGKKGKGLSKLSEKVRNKIGYMQGGGPVANPYNRPFLPLETERMGFLGNLPSQNVDFQLSNFDKNSGVNNVLANRLFEADSLNQLPVQHSNFELSNFRPSPFRIDGDEMSDEEKESFANLNNISYKQLGGVVNRKNILQKDGKLYDGLTQEAVQEYMEEAGAITGLGNKFDPTNPEHVKKLQEGLLGAYKGPGYDRMLSGNESAYINKGGEFSKNNAGQDGRFGIDTFNALKQFTEEKPVPLNLSRQSVQPFEIPITGAPLLNMEQLPQQAPVTQNTSETSEDNEGGGVKDFLKNTALKSLPGLAKGIEYMNTYNTLNKMLPPPDLTLNRPQYLNTNVDISSDLNALNEAGVMRERALTDSSTKANNVRTNLAGQDASFNKVRGKLFQDQRNRERQLQNAQTAMNFKTEDENRKRIYDNAMNQRDFINDQSRARRDFTSGVVGDVMDYTTQNTDRQSQMGRMNALMPYLNQFGVFDRAYDEDFLGKYPFMKELLGLKT